MLSLQEQAELKIRASELRAKEEQLAVEREALERERQELRLEKERVSTAALRTRLRAEEVESMSQVPGSSAWGAEGTHDWAPTPASPADTATSLQVASEKFEEGQRALCEARQVQQQQQARLQLVQQQQEHLRQQEQHMHQARLFPAPATPTTSPSCPPPQPHPPLSGWGQEHLSLAHQRLRLDRIRQDLPSSPVVLLPKAQGPAASCLSGK